MLIIKQWSFFSKVLQANFGKLKAPYKIFLVVTKSCGSRCMNCHIWRETPREELTLPEYDLLAKNLGKSLSWLNLSGGEPTDRQDLLEVIDVFVKNCPNLFIVNFTSNGLNPQNLLRVASYLQEAPIPIVGINISIDGPEKIHNQLRGQKDSYQKAIASLKALRQFKKLKIHASMTLFEKNTHLIEETFQNIKQHIPDFKRSELHLNQAFHSEHYYRNSQAKDLANSPQQISYSYSSWSFSPFAFLKRVYLNNLSRYNQTKITPLPCSAMTSNVYISEHGELFTCTIWNEKVGSLRENHFNLNALMKTPTALKLQADIAKKECPNCWSPCEAFPSIIDNLTHSIK